VCWAPKIRIHAFYITIGKSTPPGPWWMPLFGLTEVSVQSRDGPPVLLTSTSRCVEGTNTSPDQNVDQRAHVVGTLVSTRCQGTLPPQTPPMLTCFSGQLASASRGRYHFDSGQMT
jgi:hypothetical protein